MPFRFLPLVFLLFGVLQSVKAQPDADPTPVDTGTMVSALTDAWLGNHEAALAALNRLVEQQPYASVYAATSDVYARMGWDLEAREAMERAASMAPEEMTYAVALGNLQEESGLTAEAESTYRSVLAEDENNVDALLGLARIEEGRGNTTEALRLLEQVNTTFPTTESLNAAAELEAKATVPSSADEPVASPGADNEVSDTDASMEEVLNQFDQNPENVDVWQATLNALATHPHERAETIAEDALLLFPDRPELVIPASEILAESDPPRVNASNLLGLLDKDNFGDPKLEARGWGALAITQAKRGETQEAASSLNKVEALLPGSVVALHAKSHLEVAQGNRAAALEAWNQALALDPDHEVIASHLNE